ncbi:MAG TPA: MBL fold metallo-hydrolase, partial [Bacillota bacterium]|nr:MBL fold metallo-hydrolase [Bacillota bacterium]
MKVTIYRGTKEIGGTLIELATASTRILIDAGYPLFLKNAPINDDIAKLPKERLLELGVLPNIRGLYSWDAASFDAIVVSHAHIDHYGLLKYAHPDIPVYMSDGTRTLIEVSQRFRIVDTYPLNTVQFRMYEPFTIGEICITPYLMDHSAFDAAAFEIRVEEKTVIYTGDFRGHGRKAVCFDRFIDRAKEHADLLLSEGTMLGRQNEVVLMEDELELKATDIIRSKDAPVLVQSSSQNIDRIVSFFRAAQRCRKTFVVAVYTAN